MHPKIHKHPNPKHNPVKLLPTAAVDKTVTLTNSGPPSAHLLQLGAHFVPQHPTPTPGPPHLEPPVPTLYFLCYA